MFKSHINYVPTNIGHNKEFKGKDLLIYPENKLPEIVVKSDFGDCRVITSDVYDLFNQERIANLGPDVVRDFIARNYPLNSSISEQISKMSDNAIMDSIKPRNIQSYSELMQWSKYLEMRIENGLNAFEPELTPEPAPEPAPEPKTE